METEQQAIVGARETDHEQIVALLEAAVLPTSDITPSKLEHFSVLHDGGDGDGNDAALAAVGGLEIFDDADDAAALLRSVAVADSHRGRGIGQLMVRRLERIARARRQQEVAALYLLTTTADRFFSKLGYSAVPRASVPKCIQNTREFSEICPASAVCMVKKLR